MILDTKKKNAVPMKTVQIGVWSGILATSAMTLALFKIRQILPLRANKPLPPAEITGDVTRPANLSKTLSAGRRVDMTMVSHFAYGIGCATLYSFFQRKAKEHFLKTGVIFGIGVWAGSYLGVLPAMKSRASALKMSPANNFQMLLAHIVWGATLGYAEHQFRQRGSQVLKAQ